MCYNTEKGLFLGGFGQNATPKSTPAQAVSSIRTSQMKTGMSRRRTTDTAFGTLIAPCTGYET